MAKPGRVVSKTRLQHDDRKRLMNVLDVASHSA